MGPSNAVIESATRYVAAIEDVRPIHTDLLNMMAEHEAISARHSGPLGVLHPEVTINTIRGFGRVGVLAVKMAMRLPSGIAARRQFEASLDAAGYERVEGRNLEGMARLLIEQADPEEEA